MTATATSPPTGINIDEWYSYIGYFDTYSGSVMMCLFLTGVVLFIALGFQVLKQKEDIAADWENQRCNPKYIPFAGLINKPYDKSIIEFTQENFEYCVQNTSAESTGAMTQPLTQLTQQLSTFYQHLAESINNMREALNNVRDNTRTFTEDVMGRVLNVTIPLQQMLLSFRDMIGKTQGVLTSTLMAMLGTYDTLQSLMGAMLELIVKLLVTMAAIIVGLWATPATWPVAASTSLVFMSISIPLAIIAAFMSSTLHVHSSGIPKLRCFDRNTSLYVVRKAGGGGECDAWTPIQSVVPGDWISAHPCQSPVQITGKFKVLASDLDMYYLGKTSVSGTHLVQYRNKWVRVRDHPNAVRIPADKYNEPFVYCINTTSKSIYLDGIVFSDWDETQLPANAHLGQGHDHGYPRTSTYIASPDILLYGTVQLLDNRWHALTNTGYFYIADENGVKSKVLDYNTATSIDV